MKWTLDRKVGVSFFLNQLCNLAKTPLVSRMVFSSVKPEELAEWFPNVVAHHSLLGNEIHGPYMKST